MTTELDHLDERLAHELQEDGRTPMESIAAALGMSRSAARSRYERLVALGALRVVGVVDPASQGLHSFAHLSVFVTTSARSVAQAIAVLPTTPLVSIVSGRASVVAEVRAQDISALQSLIHLVKALDGVHHVEAAIYTRRVKDRAQSVTDRINPTMSRIDGLDRSILDILQTDGRISYARLAREVSCAPSAARARVQRLIACGVLRVTAIVPPGRAALTQMCGLGLRLSQTGTAIEALTAASSVSYLSLTVGRWDAIATLRASSPEDVAAEVDRFRTLPGVDSIETWTHLKVVKEDYRIGLSGQQMTSA